MAIIKQTYRIENMMCAMCVAHVQKTIEGCSGVKNVSVNLASNSALIEFDDTIISAEQIKEAVDNSGYKMIITQEGIKEKEEREKKN